VALGSAHAGDAAPDATARPSDRVLIVGEAASKPWFGIKEALRLTTDDAAEARRTMRA
jgi:hypothetical protein